MNKQLRTAGLVILLGLVLGFGSWQPQGWAAGQAGNGLKQAGNKLKQLFSPAATSKAFSPAPRSALALAPAAPMAAITVTSLADGAANAANCPGANCRLRDAVAAAAAGDTIDISVAGTITLTNNYLLIAKNLTIQGPGAAQLTISGNNQFRVFDIRSGFTVALSDLTIANGGDGFPGGGISNSGTLTLTNCTLTGNRTDSNGILGGGIYNTGALTITGCTLTGNTAGNGGGISNEGVLTLTNSTLSGNSAAGGGGGIDTRNGSATISNSTLSGNTAGVLGGGVNTYFGGMTIINSTLSGNLAGNSGGGIYNYGNSTSILRLTNCTITNNSSSNQAGGVYINGSTHVRNTIIAGNYATVVGPDVQYGSGTFNSLGYNLIGVRSNFQRFIPTTGDQFGGPTSPINPLLGPLANYGGPTQTYALLPGSPAINAGANCVLTNNCASDNLGFNLTTDQRGASFNRQVGSQVDIGAFESRGFTLAIAGGNNQSAPTNTAFANPLAVTVTAGGAGEPTSGGRVTFTPPVSGASATIAGNPATIDGGAATTGIVTANAAGGSYNVAASATGAASVNFALTNTIPCTPPGISVQPAPLTVCAGAPASFSVTSTGAGLSYQWRKGGVAISGATGSSFTFPSVTAGDAGSYDVVVAGSCGTVTSSAASLTISGSTTINTQPANQTICLGAPASFSVSASGTGALSYQWRKNGAAIGGATASAFSIAATGAGDAGSYDVVVTSNCGVVTSNAATLAFNAATAISTQPGNRTVCVGAPASFSVTASGAGPFSYQWRKNGSNIAGATSSSYAIASAAAADAGSYDVVITSSCGALTSQAATLTVNAGATITSQPTNQTVCAGSPASFSVTALGSGLTYQWRRNGSNIAGATSSSYNITSAAAGNAGSYDVVITSSCGALTSQAATLTVNPATAITTQPSNQTACDGGSVSFSVTATGAGLSYQWRKNGSNIAGATSSSYAIASAAAADAGSYDAVITSSCGALTSQAATLTVNSATAIATQPANQNASAGQSVTFSVTAAGSGLTYQWRKNGSAISGATAGSYTIASVAAADAGNYSVVVTGVCGSVTSNIAVLTVSSGCAMPAATITGPASGSVYPVGAAVNFSGAFTDASGGTHTATWKFNAITQPGVVNEAARTVSADYTFTQAGVYQVTLTVSNNCGGHSTATLIGGLTAMVAVYDPNDGFITGAGSISSPRGAYPANLSLTGNAVFAFAAKYLRGAAVPIGETLFKLGSLNFNGAGFEWLVVTGARAQLKGSGKINNSGNYGFILTLIDGQISGGGGKDKFRIKIWDETTNSIVYDNQMGAPDSADPTMKLTGGVIAIIRNLGLGAAIAAREAEDSDGDGKADFSLLPGQQGLWLAVKNGDGATKITLPGFEYEAEDEELAPGDYDGDGQTDVAVFRRSDGRWFINRSSDDQIIDYAWGMATDLPSPADYDGDGKTDIAVWRPSDGSWQIVRSTDGQIQIINWGAGLSPYLDAPVPADYDGDGKADVAIFRRANGVWYVKLSSNGAALSLHWGNGNDAPAPADYDGDGKADFAVWRASEGAWHVVRSTDGKWYSEVWGASSLGDIQVVGDYDGDGLADVAVWKAAKGSWRVRCSRDQSLLTNADGQAGDALVTAPRPHRSN